MLFKLTILIFANFLLFSPTAGQTVTCSEEQLPCNTTSGSVCCQEGEVCRSLPHNNMYGSCCDRFLCCSESECTCPETGTYCCADGMGTTCNTTDVCCGKIGEDSQCCPFITSVCLRESGSCVASVNPEICLEKHTPPCLLEDGTVTCCPGDTVCGLGFYGNVGACCPLGTGCPLLNGSIICVENEDEQCCYGHVCPASSSCCGDSDCCGEGEICVGVAVDARCQPVQDECEGFNCGPSDRCCNDTVIGKVCYNEATHKCADNIKLCGANDEVCVAAGIGAVCYDPRYSHCIRDMFTEQMHLCSIHDGVCGGVCYDVTSYRCVGGQIVQL